MYGRKIKETYFWKSIFIAIKTNSEMTFDLIERDPKKINRYIRVYNSHHSIFIKR